MITTATRKGNREYWSGYRAADWDIYECGLEYAGNRYRYGSGHTHTWWRGYNARLGRGAK